MTAETEWISAAIDETDPIPSSFTLEVSSPGMARPLRKPRDFARFAGQTVAVGLGPGEEASLHGRSSGYRGEAGGMTVALEVDGERVELPFDSIKKCTIEAGLLGIGNYEVRRRTWPLR